MLTDTDGDDVAFLSGSGFNILFEFCRQEVGLWFGGFGLNYSHVPFR